MKRGVFYDLPLNEKGFYLLSLPIHRQRSLLKKLSDQEIVDILNYLDPDECADLIQHCSKTKRQHRIIEQLNSAIRSRVQFLVKFDPKTAAGMMDLNYIGIRHTATFGDVRKLLVKHEKKTGRFPEILVVKKGFLIGELPGHILILHSANQEIRKHIRKVPSAYYSESQSSIVRKFRNNPHGKIVVLNDDKSILGVIYSDDILRLIQKRSGISLIEFAGVSKEEDVLDSALTKVRYRYKWLIINLGTAFLAAAIVSLFQDTISTFILLAVYMPIVAGMGGNAGTQTLAVTVRGIALKEITLQTAKNVIINEILAGAINGVIIGVIVSVIAFLINESALLGLVLGIAMIINLVVAGFFGAIMPLIMKQLGKDPATSATIFITTATDVLGFLAFLGLAALIL